MFRIIWNTITFLGLLALFTIGGVVAGYESEQKNDEIDAVCINSACEKPCSEVKRFKRHEGCKP